MNAWKQSGDAIYDAIELIENSYLINKILDTSICANIYIFREKHVIERIKMFSHELNVIKKCHCNPRQNYMTAIGAIL